jgi:O-antigen ligase
VKDSVIVVAGSDNITLQVIAPSVLNRALPQDSPLNLDSRQFGLSQYGPAGLGALYSGVLLFWVLYCFRPEDFVSFLNGIPLAKVAGIFTGIALVAALFQRVKLCVEAKLLLALFVWLCLTIPSSTWRGGSFELIANGFSKVVLIAIAAMCSISNFSRLRRLMVIQTLALLFMAPLAFSHGTLRGRMWGVGKMFADPNDFALNLCVVLPFCVSFFLSSHSRIAKSFWAGASLVALVTIFSTFSRGGFLALLAVFFAMWHRFCPSIRTKVLLIIVAGIGATVGLLVGGATSYVDRMETIVHPEGEGSAEARRRLLIKSLELTLKHPLFGVGPGQFEEASGAWLETHNSYTQLTAEAGIPAFLLFFVLLRRTLRNLRRAQAAAKRGTQAWYIASGLYCGMAGYIVGAFFLPTAYLPLSYMLVAYGTAAARINAGPSVSSSDLPLIPGGTSLTDVEREEDRDESASPNG